MVINLKNLMKRSLFPYHPNAMQMIFKHCLRFCLVVKTFHCSKNFNLSHYVRMHTFVFINLAAKLVVWTYRQSNLK